MPSARPPASDATSSPASPDRPVDRPADPSTHLAITALATATDRLLATVDGMTEAQFAAPSLLPGWSRAHVLAHLALNAKGLGGVLTKLGQPDPLPMYASDARRDADIDALAARSAAHIADRLAIGSAILSSHLGGGPTPEEALEAVGEAGQAAASVAAARASHAARGSVRADPGPTSAAVTSVHAVPSSVRADPGSVRADPGGHGGAPEPLRVFERAAGDATDTVPAWSIDGTFERTPGGPVMPAAQIPFMRWREVEIHHADLGLGYGPGEWPDGFADYLLGVAAFDRSTEIAVTLRPAGRAPLVLGGGGPTVSGSAANLAWWLVGRGRGEQISCTDGTLPELGPWVRR